MTRVMPGIIAALLLALASVGWLYRAEVERNGALLAQNRQLGADLREQSAELSRQAKRIEQTQALLVAAETEKRTTRQRARHYQARLKEALADESCADTDLPGAVVERLRSGGGGQTRDHSGEPAGSAAAGL